MKNFGPRGAGLLLAATMLLLSACASKGTYATGQSALAESNRAVAIDVSNHNWMDIVVYAISSAGNRVRLGSVTTGFDERFRLPRSMNAQAGNFYLEAHLVGSSEAYTSGPILANPGSRVVWSVENQIGLSNYHVASR